MALGSENGPGLRIWEMFNGGVACAFYDIEHVFAYSKALNQTGVRRFAVIGASVHDELHKCSLIVRHDACFCTT